MVNFLYLVGGVIILSIISLFVWMLIEKRREDLEPQDRSNIINYMPKQTHGHNKGVLNRIIENGDYLAVEMFPRDINLVEKLKDKKNVIINPEVIFIPKTNLIPIQRGGWSTHVNDFEVIPIKIEDIPAGFNEDKKEYLKKVIEKKQQERNNLDIFESWKLNNNKVMMKTSGLKIIEDYMSLNEEANKQIMKQIKGEEKKFTLPNESK